MPNTKTVKSILYVEDEPAIQEELAEVLEGFCENLYLANNGSEGIELYRKYRPELIVSDIKMPVMDGLEMAKQIVKLDSEAHIIFTTAFNDTQFLQSAIGLHADGYILKPIDLDLLEKMIKKSIKVLNLQKALDTKMQNELKQKAELEVILSTTRDGIAIVDSNLHFLYANPAYIKMMGYSLQTLKEKNCYDLTLSKYHEKFKKRLEEVREKGFVENIQKECITKNQKTITVNMSMALMPDRQHYLLSTKDISEDIRSHKLIERYITLIDENIITSSTDLRGVITYASDAFCKITGYTKEELIGKKHNIVRHPDMSRKVYEDLWKTLSSNQVWSGEFKNRKKDGGYYWVTSKIYPVYDEDDKKTGYTAIRQDITYLKKVEEMSITDSLTELANRRYFNEMFPKFIQSAKRNNEIVCFGILDIDHFKQYNDTYGHLAGDEALKEVAKVLKNTALRGDDYVFRLGGEEFGILYKSASLDRATDFANEVLQNIRNLQMPHINNSACKYVSASIGLAAKYSEDISDEDTFYKEADDFLYKAKESGRNRVESNVLDKENA